MIRDFFDADRDFFCKLCEEFYSSPAVSHSVNPENFAVTFDLIMQKSPYARGLILTYEGDKAGYALLSFTHSNEAGGTVVWTEEAYILPQYRGKGLGKELFEFIEREYKETAKRIRLEVTDANERAAALYRRLGYESLDYRQMLKEL